MKTPDVNGSRRRIPLGVLAIPCLWLGAACDSSGRVQESDVAALVRTQLAALQLYEDPPPVRSYPASEDRINGWIYAGQMDSIRQHGWDVWESITAPSSADPTLPVWETWYSGNEVFVYDALPVLGQRAHFRDFELPKQLNHPSVSGGPVADSAEAVTSFNRFTASTANYIWDNQLNNTTVLRDTLRALLAAGVATDSLQVLVSADSVDDLSVVLKPVFQFISWDSASLITYYAGDDSASTTNPNNPIAITWRQGVWVDPTGELEPGQFRFGTLPSGDAGDWPVTSIDDFYQFTLTAADSAAFGEFAAISGDDVGAGDDTSHVAIYEMIRPGNVALLVAMHSTTKEIPNWTWNTFWWAMSPTEGYGGDRPQSIQAPWNHYNMRVAYSMVDPPGQRGGEPNVQWNPYLESSLQGTYAPPDDPTAPKSQWYGPQTNCVTCHRMASISLPGDSIVPGYLPALYSSPADPVFDSVLKTDFLWSVAIRNGVPTPPGGGF